MCYAVLLKHYIFTLFVVGVCGGWSAGQPHIFMLCIFLIHLILHLVGIIVSTRTNNAMNSNSSLNHIMIIHKYRVIDFLPLMNKN